MAPNTITIQVDPQVAQAYNAGSAEDQQKMQLLLNIWLKELTQAPAMSLSQLMDDISDKAQARGLTPEELDAILNEE